MSGERARALAVRRPGAGYSGGGKEGGERRRTRSGDRGSSWQGDRHGGLERFASSGMCIGARQGKDARVDGQGTWDLEEKTPLSPGS